MTKKKLSGWLSALGAIAAAIVVSRGGKPATPAAGDHTAAWTQACADLYQQELSRAIDSAGTDECLRRIHEGAQDADLRSWLRSSDEYAALHTHHDQPAVVLPVLHVDGHIFRTSDGEPWRWEGVSAFALLDRYAKGEDIQPFLKAYAGYNVLRVWPYVPRADWGDNAWDVPSVETIRAFLRETAAAGWYVELTLLTDDSPARLAWARDLIPQLAGTPGLLLEAGNEPTTHKSIDTHALRDALDASGLLYSSGDYEDSGRFFGTFLTAHTGRDGEWPRRAHDLLDYYQGGGPNAPSDPAHRMPIIADEPIRPDQAGFNAADFRAYFAASALLGGGATYHTESGKYAQLPTPDEAQLAAVALDALNAFPADAPQGSYRRPVESSLRTYVVGERYMVRIRPTTKDAPEPGWTALDADGITWRKQ